MLYSFDIFDTLITRNTATPDGIFALMQYELQHNSKYAAIDKYIKDNFYILRENAENLARENFCRRNIEEITLSQVYMCMSTTGLISVHDTALLIELELHTEWENVIGISNTIDKIHRLLSKGKRILLLSDMYLSASQIRKLISKVDKSLSNLEIVVSSDVGLTKRTGNLYKYVHEKLKIEYSYWHHYGDNLQSDVLNPLRYGIDAKKCLYPELNDNESILINGNKDDAFLQLSIGISRNCRIRCNKNSQAWLVGNSSVAPILVTYVQWILDCAKKQKIRRLYFIARDGYVLKKIADKLICLYKYDMTTKYIYGSRKAWRLPSFSGTVDELRNIIAHTNFGQYFSLEKLSKLLDIEIGNIKRFLPSKYRYCCDEDRVLYYDVVALCKNDGFRDYLLTVHKDKNVLAQNYLLQEIDFSDARWAFVELHGTGFTMGCLRNLLKPYCSCDIKTFYLTMDRVGDCGDSFVYNLLSLQSSYKGMLELFCRAPHGQTIGYELTNGKVSPVIEKNNDTNWHAGYYDEYLHGVLMYVDGLSTLNNRYNFFYDIKLCERYFSNITSGKDIIALNYWGDIVFSHTNENKDIKKFAPKLSKKNIRDIFLWNMPESYNGVVLPLSVTRCNIHEKARIEYYKKHKKEIVERYRSLFKIKDYDMSLTDYDNIFNRLLWDNLPSSIIIYGAGKFGRAFHRQAQAAGITVVAWLDKNYIKLGLDGDKDYLLAHPDEHIFIAILNSELAQSLKEEFVELGVSQDSVLLLDDVMCADTFFDI